MFFLSYCFFPQEETQPLLKNKTKNTLKASNNLERKCAFTSENININNVIF